MILRWSSSPIEIIPNANVPTIHPNFYPTGGIQQGDPVTFKVRTFNTSAGKELWDFGDGSEKVEVHSDGNAVKLSPNGYAVTTHRYQRPGDYVVRVGHTDEFGMNAIGHLHVHVDSKSAATTRVVPQDGSRWARLAQHFSPPNNFVRQFRNFKSPQFADESLVRTATD